MGNFTTGFFGAIGDKLKDVADRHKANEDKLRDIKANSLHDAISSGNLNHEQMTAALDELQKLYPKSKGIKGAFDKVRQIGDLFHKGPQSGAGGGQGQPQTSSPSQPPAMSEQIPGANASSTGPNAPSLPARAAPSASASAPQSSQSGGSAPKSAPAPPPSMADIMSAAHPSPQAQDDRAFDYFKRQEELKHKFKLEEEQAKANAPGNARAVEGHAWSVADAKAAVAQDPEFAENLVDSQGRPLDLESIPEGQVLYPVHLSKGKSYWRLGSAAQRNTTFDNVVHRGSTYDPSGGAPLGAARVGSTSESVKGIDATSGADVTRRTTTPATGGSKSSPTAPPQGPTAKSPSSSDLLPSNATSQRIAPVREAYTQLFGDPTQPSATSLSDFAALADDPKASKKVASAVRLVLDGMEQEEKRSGSLFTLIKNYGGVPQALIGSQLAINKDIIGKLNPEETRAFNSVISSLSTVMGLRSLTKASAAKFSVAALERDVPVPGLNAMSSAAFNDKMARLAEEVYTGSRTVPLPANERKYIESLPGKFRDKAQPKSKSSPSAPPKLSDAPSIDDEIKRAIREAQKPAD